MGIINNWKSITYFSHAVLIFNINMYLFWDKIISIVIDLSTGY